MGETH